MREITIIAIAFNEALRVKKFVEQWLPFGSVIIVDSGSLDDTVEMARIAGAQVYENSWSGFGDQKRYAVSVSETEWVLSVDLDELPSPDLLWAVKGLHLNNGSCAYAVKRVNHFLGKKVRYSGWGDDWVVRLFNKNHCNFLPLKVHESVYGYENVEKLVGHLEHHPYRNKNDIDLKVDKYGHLGAECLLEKVSNVSPLRPVLSAFWALFRTFILRCGFLDGFTGMRIAWMNFMVVFKKYRLARARLRSSSHQN